MSGAFSKRIRDLRYKTDQSQEYLGVLLGKSRETISKYEKGEREPGLEVVTRLASHFGVSTDYILGLTDKVVSSSLDSTIYPFDINEYNPYLCDVNFVKYLKIAVKLANHKIDPKYIDEYIDNLVSTKK